MINNTYPGRNCPAWQPKTLLKCGLAERRETGSKPGVENCESLAGGTSRQKEMAARNRKAGKRKSARKARRLREGQPAPERSNRELQSRLWLWSNSESTGQDREENPRWKQRRRLKNWLRDEEFEADEAVITEPQAEDAAVGESPAAMMGRNRGTSYVNRRPPGAGRRYGFQCERRLKLCKYGNQQKIRKEPLAQEKSRHPSCLGTNPVMRGRRTRGSQERKTRRKPRLLKMPEEALCRQNRKKHSRPRRRKNCRARNKFRLKACFCRPQTLERKIREAANDGEDDDVALGTGGKIPCKNNFRNRTLLPGNPGSVREPTEATPSSRKHLLRLCLLSRRSRNPPRQNRPMSLPQKNIRLNSRTGQQYTVRTRSESGRKSWPGTGRS